MGREIGSNLNKPVIEGERPTIVINAEGLQDTPSVVADKDSGERLVGLVAKRQGAQNPEWAIFSTNRYKGWRYPGLVYERKLLHDKQALQRLIDSVQKANAEHSATLETQVSERSRKSGNKCEAVRRLSAKKRCCGGNYLLLLYHLACQSNRPVNS